MKRSSLFVAVLLSAMLLRPGALLAASGDIWWYRMPPSDGFPAYVTSISFTEFGAALLTSYTGAYTITGHKQLFHHTSASVYPCPLPSDEVLQGVADLRDNVWILTSSGAISFAARTGASPVSQLVDLDGIGAGCILAAQSGVWLGGCNRVWKYDYDANTVSLFADFSTIDRFEISEMEEDVGGRILLFSRDDPRMMILDPADGSVCQSDIDCCGGTFATYIDSSYRLWISRAGGLDCYDHTLSPLFSLTRENGELHSDHLTCLLEKDGVIWAGTDGAGLEIISPTTRTSVDVGFSDGLPSSLISCIAEDRCGNVWVGTSGQGAFVLMQKNVVPFGDDGIHSFCYDPSTDIIRAAGMNSGLLEYDRTDGSERIVPGTENLCIHSVVFSRGTVVMATNSDGVKTLDTGSGAIRPLPGIPESCRFADFGPGGMTLSLLPSGDFLVASDSLYLCDPKAGVLESYPLPEGCATGTLSEVYGSGCTWFVDSRGLYSWNSSSPNLITRVLDLSDKGVVRSATLGPEGRIWLAVGTSLACYDIDSASFSFVDCPLTDIPMSVLCDRNGRIWIGTESSLHAYFPNSGKLASMGGDMGVSPNEYLPLSRLALPDGTVLLGGCEGALMVNPDISFSSQDELTLVLDEFTVDGRSLQSFDGIKVPPRYQMVHLGFHAVAPDVLRTKTYRFHISGSNMDREFMTATPYLNYYSLPSGHYTVSGACSLRDGSWTEMRELVGFEVLDPWYMRWWFISLLALILALAAVYTMSVMGDRRKLANEEKANNERYNFFVNISHELRTPLTLVMGQVNRLLQKPDIGDADKVTLRKIFRQSEKMKTLLNTVLTSSKIKAGVASIKLSDVDVNRWTSAGIDQFRDEAAGHNMDIIFRPDPDAGFVSMDDQLCQIVLSNIMMNAIKHNSEGMPIVVRTESVPERKTVCVSVRDHGTGISSEEVSKVFERFYRESEEKTGFGIGLSYSKTIMDAHGGRIGARNNSGDDGATFWFEIDSASPSAAKPSSSDSLSSDHGTAASGRPSSAAAAASGGKDPRSSMAYDFSGVSALFVDDDPDLRQFVDDEVGALFGTFHMASNGRDALSYARSHHVDVVVSDVMMSGMDGVTMCRTIKSDPALSTLPVILLTARADTDSRARGYASGADYYLSKPFELSELLEVIRQLTTGRA